MAEDGEGNRVSNIQKAEEIPEKLRQEPYKLFNNDRITKSLRQAADYRTVLID